MFLKRKKIKSLSDEELISQYREQKSSIIWSCLYERYLHLVYGVCLKYLKNTHQAEDATMHLFEKLPEFIEKYEIKEFRPWLYTITKNHCFSLIKSEQKVEIEAPDLLLDTTEEEAQQELPLKELTCCINKLSLQQRTCVELFYFEKKSYQEIVDSTGYTFKNVKSHIQNGKRNLKNCLEA